MNAGLAALNGFIAKINELESLEGAAAREAAPLVEAALKKTAAAGQNPDGTPWAERKEGGRAYANAATKIACKPLGNIVQCTLTGPEAFGQRGDRGMPKRASIPIVGAELPAPVAEACAEGARRAFDKIMNGSSR